MNTARAIRGISTALLATFAVAFTATAASAVCEDELKLGKAAYKRCKAYLSMAGTPTQRKAAEEQSRKDREKAKCKVIMSGHKPLKVCGDVYGSPSERHYEVEKKKRKNEGNDAELKPIVNNNSGAFGPPSKPAAAPCPPNHVFGRSGQCVPAGQCRPGHVLSRTGQCVRA
jgi:hypothetical protein